MKTTRQKLKSPRDAPLISSSDGESFNPMSLKTNSNVNSPIENSKQLSYSGSGYNSSEKKRGNVPEHKVFVLDTNEKPLTPTTNARARKLMKGKQAKPTWNKFSQFGIQMLVKTRKETPKTILGVDFGTKFEGYAVRIGKENNLSVMWKLPDKKKLIRKLEERRILRRTRRQRNCRRRECRFNNRNKKEFIAPSQLMIIQSRIRVMREFFNCYPFDTVALEDVRFNHRDKRWGKNFSTIEVGKKFLYDWIEQKAELLLFEGRETQMWGELFGYRKTSDKSVETFNSHCSDALAIAGSIQNTERISVGKFICVDDTYRPVRRKLHDTQPTTRGVREKYSTGNYKGIRKGTMCNFGQICGGIKDKTLRVYDLNNKRLSKNYSKIGWLSHHFKIKEVRNSPQA